MKTTFNNSELAHVWATQTQEHGTNKNGSFYFRGKSIFSYGSHFEIARFVDDETVLFTARDYSVTTGQHKHKVLYAINHLNVFEVVDFDDMKKNIDYYIGKINNYSLKHLRARKYDYSGEIEALKEKCIKLSERFKIRLTKSQKDKFQMAR